MSKQTDSYYVETELKERVDRAAKMLDRTRSWVIRKCLDIGLPLLEQGNRPKLQADDEELRAAE